MCIAISDISPLTSPPGLSPSPTETSLYPTDSPNSEITSPTVTDLSSDITTSEGEENDRDGFMESDSETLTAVLDSRLFAVLGHDLELAARLIPRIHALLQWSFTSDDVAARVVPSEGPGGTSGKTSPSSVSGSPTIASSTAKRTDLHHQKRKRDSEEEDDARRNRRSSRARNKFGPNSPCPPSLPEIGRAHV